MGPFRLELDQLLKDATLSFIMQHAACSKGFRCSKENFIIEFCSKINIEACWQYKSTTICEHASGYLYLFLCCMIYFYIISLSFFSYKFYCYMLVLILKYFAYLIFFWVDPDQPIWPVTRSLDRFDHRVRFQNYGSIYDVSQQESPLTEGTLCLGWRRIADPMRLKMFFL